MSKIQNKILVTFRNKIIKLKLISAIVKFAIPKSTPDEKTEF